MRPATVPLNAVTMTLQQVTENVDGQDNNLAPLLDNADVVFAHAGPADSGARSGAT